MRENWIEQLIVLFVIGGISVESRNQYFFHYCFINLGLQFEFLLLIYQPPRVELYLEIFD